MCDGHEKQEKVENYIADQKRLRRQPVGKDSGTEKGPQFKN